MPVESRWYNEEKTIIIQAFINPYTFDELHADYKQISILLNEVSHRVDFISDMSRARSSPRGTFAELSSSRKNAPQFNHPRAGVLVYIANNKLFARLIKLFLTMFPDLADSFYPATSIEEAVEIITEIYKSRKSAG